MKHQHHAYATALVLSPSLHKTLLPLPTAHGTEDVSEFPLLLEGRAVRIPRSWRNALPQTRPGKAKRAMLLRSAPVRFGFWGALAQPGGRGCRRCRARPGGGALAPRNRRCRRGNRALPAPAAPSGAYAGPSARGSLRSTAPSACARPCLERCEAGDKYTLTHTGMEYPSGWERESLQGEHRGVPSTSRECGGQRGEVVGGCAGRSAGRCPGERENSRCGSCGRGAGS